MTRNALFVSSLLASVAAATTVAHADKWTGVYLGVGGGYGMANHEVSLGNGPLVPPPPGFSVDLDGLGGRGGFLSLSVGADYQIHHNFLVGAFFDYDFMDIGTEINASLAGFGLGASANAGFEIKNQWSLGGRIGYLPTSRTLLFLSAGYTQVDVSDMTFSASATGLGSTSGVLASVDNLSGYFIGGGAEVRLTDAISIKGEYRYTNLGSENVTLLPGLAPVINNFVSTQLDTTIQTARVSLNYRFGLGHSPTEPEPITSIDPGPADKWTGVYLGVGGGYGMANHEVSLGNGPLVPPPPGFSVDLDGLGGRGGFLSLSLGADYQIHHNFLVGAFFDYDFMDIGTEINASLAGFGLGASANAGFEIKNQWSLGGRIGYLPTSRTLLFLSAGYTQVDVSDMTFSASATGLGSTSGVLASVDNLSGYFIGGGAEVRLTDAISIKGEYRYTNLGSENVTLLPGLAPVINNFVSTQLDTAIQTARVSLNYRFNWDRPTSEPLK